GGAASVVPACSRCATTTPATTSAPPASWTTDRCCPRKIHANAAANGGSTVAAIPAAAGVNTRTAPTARKNGISVPRTPTPSTARVTCTSPSDATGQDHHGSTTPHAIVAKTNPHTSTVAGSAPRRPAASAVSRYPAKKKAEATPAATPNPFSDPKPWYAW